MSDTKEYLAKHPALRPLYALVKKLAPHAEESMSYGTLAFKTEGQPLVYLGGFAKHISVFPSGSGIDVFKKELAGYHTSKGTIQLKHGEKLPTAVLTRLIKYRIKENEARSPFAKLSKPARRALSAAGIHTVKQLAKHREQEVLTLHGMGKASLPHLHQVLAAHGLKFKR